MKYNCKFPKRMNDNEYYKKIINEMQASDRYNDLLRDEMKWPLSNVIINIKGIIQDAKNDREQILDFIANLHNIATEEEFLEATNDEDDARSTLFMSVHGYEDIITYDIKNPRPGMMPRYQAYLKEVAARCIKDIVAANRPSIKKVSFNEIVKETIIYPEKSISEPEIATQENLKPSVVAPSPPSCLFSTSDPSRGYGNIKKRERETEEKHESSKKNHLKRVRIPATPVDCEA